MRIIKSTHNQRFQIALLIVSVFFQIVICTGVTCDHSSPKPLVFHSKSGDICINISDCKDDVPTKTIYATDTKCSLDETDCPRMRPNLPGYKRLPKDAKVQYTECVLCPQDNPVATEDFKTCGTCPGGLIFSYESGQCKKKDEIFGAVQPNGWFSLDMKIFYTSDIHCPFGQIKEDFQFSRTSLPDIACKRCKWCPREKIVADFDKNTCSPCAQGEIVDEIGRKCLKQISDCKGKLSSDSKFCLLQCPYGEVDGNIVGTYTQCKHCDVSTPYPSSDHSKCVVKCSDISEVLNEKSKSCIKFESCEGFYSENDKTVCLEKSCLKSIATQDKPAIMVLAKADGKSYQECKACPKDKAFLMTEGNDKVESECIACPLVSDYKSGKCSSTKNNLQGGILDQDGQNYYPQPYKCSNGFVPFLQKLTDAVGFIQKCTLCPSHIPLSSTDGQTCTLQCPVGKIANEDTHSCIDATNFDCKLKLSSDGKMCSSDCPSGEIFEVSKDIPNKKICKKCPTDTPLRSPDGLKCVKLCEFAYDKRNDVCMTSKSMCKDNFIIQPDNYTCDGACPDKTYPIIQADHSLQCKTCASQYRKNTLNYFECSDQCGSGYYGNPTDFSCQPVSQCNKFISGSVPFCSDKCKAGEYMNDKLPNETFTKCSQTCDYFKQTKTDGSLVCTKNCEGFVSSDKSCVKKCPDNEFLIDVASELKYKMCALSCPSYYFEYQIDGAKKCVTEDNCTYFKSSGSKNICTKQCKQGEIAFEPKNETTKYYTCSADKCNQFQYVLKGNTVCTKTCHLFLSSDKSKCVDRCSSGQFVIEVTKGSFQCTDTCTDIQYTDDQGVLRCQKECDKITFVDEKGVRKCITRCNLFLSTDKKICSKSCLPTEYILERQQGETFNQCSPTCDAIEFIDEKGFKNCIKECSLFLSIDKKSCQKSCKPTEFALEKQQGQKFNQCTDKCDDLSFTDEKGNKICSKTCPYYLSVDSKSCDHSCKEGQFANDKLSNQTFFQCSTKCDGFEYTLDDSKKRCGQHCPLKQIQFISQQSKVCLKSKKQCKLIISGEQCIEKCDTSKNEYSKQMNGFIQCFVCKDYYSITNGIGACSSKCPADQVGVPSLYKCVSQQDAQTACKDLKYSSDKKKCTLKCQYPEITNSKGECKQACSSSDKTCQSCQVGELSQAIGGVEQCIAKDKCDGFISSSGQKCVQNCTIIREIQQNNSKICTKCKDNEVPILGDKITCQKNNDPKIFDNKLKSAQKFVNAAIDSKDKAEEVKKQIGEVAKDIFAKVQDKAQPAKQLVSQLVSLAKTMVQQNTVDGMSDIAQTVGSKSDIITSVQKKKDGFNFKKSFNIDSIQNGTVDTMLEENKDETEEQINLLATSVIAKNPACTSQDCSAYPLFQIDYQVGSRFLQQTGNTNQFTVTFNIDNPSQIQKYVCLSYNLDKNTQKAVIMNSTPSADQKSISCLVDGNVSISLDSKCNYIAKSLCQSDQDKHQEEKEEEEDGLSGGAIAGIVIGVLVIFGAIIGISVYLFKKYKLKSANNKKYISTEKDEDFVNVEVIPQSNKK